MSRFLLLILLIGAGYGAWTLAQRPAIAQPPGILAPKAPIQTEISPLSFDIGDYRLTAQAGYDITARILGRETYHMDREAELSPLDLALGWQDMSDSALLAHLTIGQKMRWYFYRYDATTPSPERIPLLSANTHIIPASREVERQIRSWPVGSVVRLQGYLVDAAGKDGWEWHSSMTRTDTGSHSCELMYVTEATRIR